MNICENCQKEHSGAYKSGRFCSEKCARGFSTKSKRAEINQSISKKLQKEKIFRTCGNCQKLFEVKRRKKNQKFCSNNCSLKYKWKNDNYKRKMSQMSSNLAIKRHLNRDSSFGWKSRTQITPSYPESIAINYLKSNNINFTREFKEGKYFIDLAISEKKIAIEIDGKQHQKIERKQADATKDSYLKTLGWKVFRIKWFNPVNEENKEKLYGQIKDLKSY